MSDNDPHTTHTIEPVAAPWDLRYHLLQMLQRYEGFTKLHFLWHAAGPKRGEPRDYCFVEFATAEVLWGCSAARGLKRLWLV